MPAAALVVWLAGAAAGAAAAEPPREKPKAPPEPVDGELLEFLGSLDTEEEGWREFLEERPIPAAGKPASEVPRQPPPQPAKDKQ